VLAIAEQRSGNVVRLGLIAAGWPIGLLVTPPG
jgi:hypothetical protein